MVGAATALACALLASLVPAWLASRTDLVQVFKGDGGSRIWQAWGRQVLVGAQIAVALVLLTVSVSSSTAGSPSSSTAGPGSAPITC